LNSSLKPFFDGLGLFYFSIWNFHIKGEKTVRQIKISDATMKQNSDNFRLSFKEKIELSKMLDKLAVDVIELEGINDTRTDSLLIKSICAAVNDSIIAVPVELNSESVECVWSALKSAKRPRLQVFASTSPVQIEYLFHKKPDAMLEAIKLAVAKCSSLCADVEFIANDATRSEEAFLGLAIKTAIDAGAKTITLCDTAGTMLPNEFFDFIKRQYEITPILNNVTLGICTSNEISMADACAIEAISAGAGQVRCASHPCDYASLSNIARILSAKSDALGAGSAVRTTQLSRIIGQIERIFKSEKKNTLSLTATNAENDVFLTAHDDLSAVATAVKNLGYDLSDEDNLNVYNSFMEIAEKKEKVGVKELDAIVASAAMQVPQTYRLDTYFITSGNNISATAHIKLIKNNQPVEGVYIGDGSIDAAFQAIEKITGYHYELDDFQLRAVTEGREAMGETVVKLRSGTKVYSGRGISTDIVGAGIQAYLSALNKIIYEEEVE
jgi:2-isopropylmalate synthase